MFTQFRTQDRSLCSFSTPQVFVIGIAWFTTVMDNVRTRCLKGIATGEISTCCVVLSSQFFCSRFILFAHSKRYYATAELYTSGSNNSSGSIAIPRKQDLVRLEIESSRRKSLLSRCPPW